MCHGVRWRSAASSRSTRRTGRRTSEMPRRVVKSLLKPTTRRAIPVGVYCSIDKIDLAARLDGNPIAVQTDHRTRDEIEAQPELSVLFAMARVVNARSQLADDGHPTAAVHYVVADDPPALLREALSAVGGTIERADRRLTLEKLGPGSEAAVGVLADRSMVALARRAATRVGSRDLAMALRMLEDQTFANPPERADEERYWTRVLELAAL